MNCVRISVTPRPLPGKIQGNDRAGWAALYRSLSERQLNVLEIADLLYRGHAIAPVLDGWRSYDHFVAGQHIGIDLDTEDRRSAISTLIDHDLVQMYGAIIHATPSSTPTAPRSRVIFLLDQPITDPYAYKAAIRTLSAYFAGVDISSAEATRTFFGNGKLAESHNVDGLWIPSDSRLPLADLRAMYQAQQEQAKRSTRPAPDYTSATINIQKTLATCIAKAAHGQRNNIGFWLFCRLAENGIPFNDAEAVARQYAAGVPQTPDRYTEQEALQSVRSAYRGE